MRRSFILLCSSLQHVPETLAVKKDYQKIELTRKEAADAARKKKEFENYPLRYQILECRPGLPLALTKLKYLVAARRTHPEAGGDPEDFLRVSLAYQDVMKDYGVETVDNQIVNLGNFQVDSTEAQNYLTARSKIDSYIPISTLEDHIKQIEDVKARLGDHLSEKLSAPTDETMWLLEDIEDMMEQAGLKTVKLQVLEDGKVKVAGTMSLTDGTEKPLFITDADAAESATSATAGTSTPTPGQVSAASAPSGSSAQGTSPPERTTSAPSRDGEAKDSAKTGTTSSQTDSGPASTAAGEGSDADKALFEATVTASDIEVLNAKNTLQDRSDVAGLASRTATEVMNNTDEVKRIRTEGAVFYVLLLCICVVIYVYIEGKARMKRQESSRPEVSEHVQADTMLPWWGNDAEYESQVKRIFVEEWRRARASSRRSQTFQEGVARESMSEDEKKKMDLQIFTVTADRLKTMRENADKHPGRQ